MEKAQSDAVKLLEQVGFHGVDGSSGPFLMTYRAAIAISDPWCKLDTPDMLVGVWPDGCMDVRRFSGDTTFLVEGIGSLSELPALIARHYMVLGGRVKAKQLKMTLDADVPGLGGVLTA